MVGIDREQGVVRRAGLLGVRGFVPDLVFRQAFEDPDVGVVLIGAQGEGDTPGQRGIE